MERRLLIISCSSRKHKFQSPQPAIDVYDGVAYRVIRKAKRTLPLENVDIMILSAEYGLIESSTLIEHYDRRMTLNRALELKNTSESIFRERIDKKHYHEIYVDLGQDYLIALNPPIFENSNAKVVLASGKIGQRLRQLKNWLSST